MPTDRDPPSTEETAEMVELEDMIRDGGKKPKKAPEADAADRKEPPST